MLIASHIVWNLFLALVPVALAAGMAWAYWRYPSTRPMWWIWAPMGMVWLGFLPNTCYLLTEWRHFIDYITRSPDDVRRAAHDKHALLGFLGLATFYVVYSGAGLLAFAMALWPIDRMLRAGPLLKGAFFLLCALGVYLGLIVRLNTWDILRHTDIVARAAADALTHPLLVLLIFGFAALLWFSYWVVDVFIDGLLLRMRGRQRPLQEAPRSP